MLALHGEVLGDGGPPPVGQALARYPPGGILALPTRSDEGVEFVETLNRHNWGEVVAAEAANFALRPTLGPTRRLHPIGQVRRSGCG